MSMYAEVNLYLCTFMQCDILCKQCFSSYTDLSYPSPKSTSKIGSAHTPQVISQSMFNP